MAGIRVRRSLHIEQPDVLEEAQVTWAGYAAPAGPDVLEAVSYGGQRGYYFTVRHLSRGEHHPRPAEIRCSHDHGRTWERVETWAETAPVHGAWHLELEGPCYLYHPRGAALLRLYRSQLKVDGLLPWDRGAPERLTGLLWTQVSRDGGRTWAAPEQLLCGPGATPSDWAPDIRFGRNCGGVEGATPLWLPDGRVLLPFFSAAAAPPGRFRSACLLGRWRPDASGLDWDLSAYASVGPDGSDDGGDEPCVATLADGRWLMVMRVRTRQQSAVKVRSARYWTVSADAGQTWSEPQPLRYTDGRQVYCPACLAHVFRATANGRLYLITNLLNQPTTGCDPRTTLHIAEIDAASLAVIPETVTVIETRDAAAGQPESIRFSNWRRYEDRETGAVVLLMSGCPGDVGRHETCGVPPHAYRYDIELPS
jgi:hypothetical protein